MTPAPRTLLAVSLIVALAAVVPLAAALPALQLPRDTSGRSATVWRLDNLESIAGHPVKVLGQPRVVETPAGRAVEFDGKGDGLVLDVNPLAGLERFTLEIVFEPAADGGAEQRFLHIEESGAPNRALIELRLLPGGAWCLDTFLRHGEASLTLIDRALAHPVARWHSAALVFDGQTMTHYVDGVRELGGRVAFKPLGPGRTSIGVRQNLVSWFKGRVRAIRVTPEALSPGRLMTGTATGDGGEW